MWCTAPDKVKYQGAEVHLLEITETGVEVSDKSGLVSRVEADSPASREGQK